MTPNSDNAMARFLFAILKQKSLKDIDWNQVAQDPVLLQPITNGHAARMRYSRFRATVTGHEPQKRSRPAEKDRVCKSSKRGGSSKKHVIIKSESGLSPVSLATPYHDDLSSRFLTPCSDDMVSVCPAAVENPQTRRTQDAFSPLIDGNSDLFTSPGGLTLSPAFSAFDDAYDDGCNYRSTSTGLQSRGRTHVIDPQPLIDRAYEWNDGLHDAQLF
ncbi:hypothetical protein E4U41_000504 [Claviceps citrina]|nr:hypothetical protein E4U41_000504 [Claviceps citrina]